MDEIHKIAEYGKTYRAQYLTDQIRDKTAYEDDWFNGLKFFFSKSFFRGRDDSLSQRFMKAAIRAMEEFKPQLGSAFDKTALESLLKSKGVNNHIDRRMVTATCEFVLTKLERWDRNVVRYAVDEITNGRVASLSNDIRKIHAVKDKLASFYLRDVVLVYDLENLVKPEDYKYYQPIDTWVKQVAYALRLAVPADEDDVVKQKIIDACIAADTSPLLFNAGAWLVGKNSLRLLLERLCPQNGD